MFKFSVTLPGVGGAHPAQGPSERPAVPEEPTGSCAEYLQPAEDSRGGGGTQLLSQPLPLQPPGDEGPGGQHPPGEAALLANTVGCWFVCSVFMWCFKLNLHWNNVELSCS